jgi:hypothetical protein
MSTTNETATNMGNVAAADALAVTRAGQKGIMVAITLVPFVAVLAAI